MAFDFITSSFTSFFSVFAQEDGGNSACSEGAQPVLVEYSTALAVCSFPETGTTETSYEAQALKSNVHGCFLHNKHHYMYFL